MYNKRLNVFTELVPIFDGYKYVGTMQICVARMLQESGIFFAVRSLIPSTYILCSHLGI